MIVGGLRALRRTDLKLLLADGTISQLGFMIAVFGWGTTATTIAGCTMLLAHGAFKATAFMVVGVVDHEHGTRDVRHLPRPGVGWGPTVVAAAVAAASMAGVPLLFGFVAKEADYTGFLDQGAGAGTALAVIVIGSALTVAYSLRFLAGVTGRLADDVPPAPGDHRPPWTFIGPALVLSRDLRDPRDRAAVARRTRRRGDDGVDRRDRRSPPRRVARPQHRAAVVGRGARRRRRAVRRPSPASNDCWRSGAGCRRPRPPTGAR